MRTLLVVGGAGYIGSHTTLLLAQQGYRIIILDAQVHAHYPPLPWATVIIGDMADTNILESIFAHNTIYAVLHLAAFMDVNQSVKHPLLYYANNVAKTITLLQAMAKYEVKRLIIASSSAVYGAPESIPIAEEALCNPASPYGMGKLMVEKIVEDASAAHGISFVALRYFNVAGAHEGGYDLGEFHTPETHIIPLLITALKEKKPFFIFGTNHPTSDGTCVRDFVHVWDVAHAHARALELLQENTGNHYFNIGSGIGTSVAQLIAMVEKINNVRLQTIPAPNRAGDPPALIAAIAKANTILGWQPRYSDIYWIIKTACTTTKA